MIIHRQLGSLECINIIREAYFRSTIKEFVNGNEKVLFVGGGTGASLEDYCQIGLKITFTDIDSKVVNYTKQIFDQKNYQIEFNCCSAYALPYEDSSYDIVVSTLNGSYFNEDSLAEFRRVLRYNGIILLSETTSEYIDYLEAIGRYDGCYILSSNLASKIWHPYVYTKEKLFNLAKAFDFDCLHYDILTPNGLIPYQRLSNVIVGLARHLNINVDDVPLLYYMFLRKRGQST